MGSDDWNPTAETLMRLEKLIQRGTTDVLVGAEAIINEARNGRMFILVDDDDRENEGDLVCAAEKVTPEIINFMADDRHPCPADSGCGIGMFRARDQGDWFKLRDRARYICMGQPRPFQRRGTTPQRITAGPGHEGALMRFPFGGKFKTRFERRLFRHNFLVKK